MTIITREQRLYARAYWMVSHRWLAIVALALLTWLGTNLFDFELNKLGLYLLAICLAIENLIALWLLEQIKKKRKKKFYKRIRLSIHFQIFFDLAVLTGILHFTGGIENPFFFIYIFHMVISSILLSRTGAFIQTTIALVLFGMLIFAEFNNLIPHYCLCFDENSYTELYKDLHFVSFTYGVFAFISYILVYLTTSIGHRLRNQEDKLTKAIGQLQRNDEIKNEYVLRITHDIKSHLAAIQTNLSVLTSGVFGKLEGKQKEFLDRAFNRTEKLTNFARSLLQLTRLRLSNKVEKQEFSLVELLEKVITDHREAAFVKSIDLSSSIDNSINTYSGNKLSFEEVFQNLVSNAIKYSNEGGKVEVTAKTKMQRIRIEVIDNGIGIPGNELRSIFNEFYRASNTKGIEAKGSGVGLSLVKEIVRQHNGRIWAENKPTGGSVFVIELPLEN